METMLYFCTRCGTKVEPYLPSTSSYFDSGEPQIPGGEDRTYWCEKCAERLVATNLCDTGWSCRNCNEVMPMRNQFCGVCGSRMKPSVEFSYDMRLFRMYQKTQDLHTIVSQLQDLRSVLFSAIQDVAVMREMMTKKGVWDGAEYKAMRKQQMLRDHSGAGPSPWKGYTFYPYTLDEDDFLRECLGASEAEVAKFKDDVDGLHTQT